MEHYYEHADDRVWSDHRLRDRFVEVQETARIPHGEARKTAIAHELDCLAFEIGRRLVEAREQAEEEINNG